MGVRGCIAVQVYSCAVGCVGVVQWGVLQWCRWMYCSMCCCAQICRYTNTPMYNACIQKWLEHVYKSQCMYICQCWYTNRNARLEFTFIYSHEYVSVCESVGEERPPMYVYMPMLVYKSQCSSRIHCIHIAMYVYIAMCMYIYGVAMISRFLKNIGFFCKRAL